MRGFVRFMVRLAIVIAVVWAIRRFLLPEGRLDKDALAQGEARARHWIDGAKGHVERAVAEGRNAAAQARSEMESEAGEALAGPEDMRRPEDPAI